ncbi:MAG: AAA family ATPase [Patescibacteria group bacterium]|nr:AAA family ATPase [Patescibacteria group bacterium]
MNHYYIIGFLAVGLVIFIYYRSQKTIAKTNTLDLYSKDLTALAKAGKLDPVIGRTHEIERVIQVLTRRTKNNPVLIGKSGVGKTAIVEELANEIVKGQIPRPLLNKKVLALDLSGLVAGTKYRGEFEKRLKMIVDEIIASKRNIIIFIDELHSLAEAGEATGAIDAADILKPALARGQLQAIGATTRQDYQKSIAHDRTLERRFQPVYIEEPGGDQTLEILKGLRHRYQKHHSVKISDEALAACVMLSNKRLKDRCFPDKAIDLMDETAAKVRIEFIKHPEKFNTKKPVVTKNYVEATLKDWSDDENSELIDNS